MIGKMIKTLLCPAFLKIYSCPYHLLQVFAPWWTAFLHPIRYDNLSVIKHKELILIAEDTF
jgi:hypothetical protein